MKLYKKAERTLKTKYMLTALKQTGWKVKNLGTWCKWKDLRDGSRLQVKITVYEAKRDDMMPAYLISDVLDRVAAPLQANKKEVLDWLKEHGYKTEKKWYIEDYGMTEETWKAWNGEGEKEE